MSEHKWNASVPIDDGWYKSGDSPEEVCKPIKEAAHKLLYSAMNLDCFE